MTKGQTRALMIITGIVCLVVAGWIGVEQFFTKEHPEISDPKVQVSRSQQSGVNPARKDAKPRSLEELNAILAGAKAEWGNLKNERFFFEDYADEVVAQFSLNEIELLGRERLGHDFRNVVGFHYAIMRRWGELDYDGANKQLDVSRASYRISEDTFFYRSFKLEGSPESGNGDEILLVSKEELEALQQFKEEENGSGAFSDFLMRLHVELHDHLYLGKIRANPHRFTLDYIASNQARLDRGEPATSLSSLNHLFLEEVFYFYTLENPDKTSELLHDEVALSLIAGGSDSSVVEGYFRGLPNGIDWEEQFRSIPNPMKEDALLPMLGRWLNDDPSEALAWLGERELPAWAFSKRRGDPFQSIRLESLPELDINGYDLATGKAVAIWFRQNPKNALEYLSENRSEYGEDFYFEVFHSFIREDSPTGYVEIFKIIQEIGNGRGEGELALAIEDKVGGFREFVGRAKWRREKEYFELLNNLEVSPDHQEDLTMLINWVEKYLQAYDE